MTGPHTTPATKVSTRVLRKANQFSPHFHSRNTAGMPPRQTTITAVVTTALLPELNEPHSRMGMMDTDMEEDRDVDGKEKEHTQDEASPGLQPHRPPNSYATASFLSKLCFTWPYPLLKEGLRRPLKDADLPDIMDADSSRFNRNYFETIWHQEQLRCPTQPNLHRALLVDFMTSVWYVQPFICIAQMAKIAQAIALGYLIDTFEPSSNRPASEGYWWATVLVVGGIAVVMEHHHVFFITWRQGMKYRIACVSAIFAKSLKLSATHSETNASTGQIMNLVSNDVERFLMATLFGSHLIWVPITSIVTLCVGWWSLGPAFGAGFALLITVFVPLQIYLSHRFAYWRSRIAKLTDRRVTFVSQAVMGARVMKMSGYEHRFLQRIQQLRHDEITQLKQANTLKIWNETLFFVSNVVLTIVICLVHVVLLDQVLTTRNVFTVVTLINVLQVEMTKHVSLGVMGVSECSVSITRIQRYLQFPELPQTTTTRTVVPSSPSSHQRNNNHKQMDDKDKPPPQQSPLSSSLPIPTTFEKQKSSVAVTVLGKRVASEDLSPKLHRDKQSPPEEQPIQSEGKDEVQPPRAVISLQGVSCYWNDVQVFSTERSEKTASNNYNRSADTTGLVPGLSNVSIEFHMGQLTCIIGTVGSGKSALLQAIVGELPVFSGRLDRCYQSMSYASQDAWIMNGTVQENILMELELDPVWYRQVVTACGLLLDFTQFQHGDQTIVGDRGIQCSGGQRARIGLARALYRNADVLVADDPLSAVDAKVGRQLFHDALYGLAVSRGKCVILVTHQHQYVTDSVCVLIEQGRIACRGSYSQCVEASNGRLTAPIGDSNVDTLEVDEAEGIPITRAKGAISKPMPGTVEDANEDAMGAGIDTSHKEDSASGMVRFETYRNYFRAMGGTWIAVALLFLYAATQTSVLYAVAKVGRWAELPVVDQDSWSIIGLVIGVGCLVVALTLYRAQINFSLTVRASQKLHDDMTMAVLRSKIEFFDTNPLGRILNRFSADVGSNDDLLPATLYDTAVLSFMTVGAIVTTLVVLPVALIAIPPLIWFFLSVRRVFVTSSRELKRLEGQARSPIFAMLSESLNGVSTIRANNTQEYFLKKFEEAHDTHTRAFFSFIASSRWVGFRMDSIMFLLMAVVSFLSVLFQERGWFDVDPAILGLSISMLLQLAGVFQWCIRQSAEVVNQMVSVERVMGYAAIEPEAPLTTPEDATCVATGWPSRGSIEVRNVAIRYRQTLPRALDGVSFSIPAGARVGVVGRTGSGKSTIVQTLFRLLEAEEGSIFFDGVDISTVGLHKLRTSISVIPQAPTLFSGCTVRENLDLFGIHPDSAIQKALDDVQLRDAMAELPNGYNSMVSEGGSNFSVGQRQVSSA
jgi:ATP-binding cassette, subfamily C (CFTR/MRP), member 4